MTIPGLDSLNPQTLLLLVPLIVVQLGLMILAVVDLLRDDRRVRGGNKGVWAVVIVFVSIVGPLLYFFVGREEGLPDQPPVQPGAMPGWGSPHDPRPAAPPSTEPMPGQAPRTPPPVTPATRPGPSSGTLPGAPATEAMPASTAPRPVQQARAPLPAGPAAIRVTELSKRYAGGVLALDRLSMEVPTGSVFGLLGPNGAGKTTCLRLLAGLTRPSGGFAEVDSLLVAERPLEVRRRLGYLEQDPRAYGWMTGREQVTMLGRLHGLGGRALDDAVAAALSRVDLADAADRRAGTYSGGMRQRLGIAGALVHRPRVVVLDEPVSALDPEGRRDVLSLIADLRGTATVLFSTHVLADVERICDRVAILDHGRLVVEGALDELLDRYALPVYRLEAEAGEGARLDALAARLRDVAWVTAAAVEHGLLTVAVSDPARASRELLPIVADSSLAVVSVARARPTLEDVFLTLTSEPRESVA